MADLKELHQRKIDAEAAYKEAQTERDAARHAYHHARMVASGLAGKIVTNGRDTVKVEMVHFIGEEPDARVMYAEGPRIKKDGTPGERRGTVWDRTGNPLKVLP